MKKLSFGVIGCGNVANNHYLPYIAKQHKLTAICDIVPERAKRSAELWNAARWYSDPDTFLRDREVEAVVITTSHEAHAPLAIRAAEEGKHFIVQKPMALSLEDAENVVRSVEKSGVVAIAEPSDALLLPAFRALKDVVCELGQHCFSIWHTGHSGPMWSEWFFREEAGGGVLYDLAVYGVARAHAVLGKPTRVTALGTVAIKRRFVLQPGEVTESISRETYGKGVYYFHNLKPSVPVEPTAQDNFAGLLEYGDGGLAIILGNYTTFTRLHMPPIQVYCTGGSVVADTSVPLISVTRAGSAKSIGKEILGESRPYYHCSIDHLSECVEKGEKPLPSVKWGYEVTKTLLALNHSVKKGLAIGL